MADLNTLVPSGSGFQLDSAVDINDRGEIVGSGILANGNAHAILLIPCDENHPNIEDCDYSLVETSTTVNGAPRIPGASLPATASSGLSPEAIRQLLRSVGFRSTPWRRRFGAQPQK